jgi:DNA-binding HxlR family transcriptional regulator
LQNASNFDTMVSMKKAQNIKRRSDCPISFGLDLFGDKWTLLIVRDILLYNRTHFRDFAPNERIATNILADRLERLESAGVIEKHQDPKLKNQFIYSATQKGKDLAPILAEMTLWGFLYDEKTPANKNYVNTIKTKHATLVKRMLSAIYEGTFTRHRAREMGIGKAQNLS